MGRPSFIIPACPSVRGPHRMRRKAPMPRAQSPFGGRRDFMLYRLALTGSEIGTMERQVVTIDPRLHDAVLFDLDGVVTDTAVIHQAAWAAAFDDLLARRPASAGEDHSPFTADDYLHFVDGKSRLDGIADFLAARGISLPLGGPSDVGTDTVHGLANRKQALYLERIEAGVPVFESTVALVRKLTDAG